MRITESKLRNIIREQIFALLKEESGPPLRGGKGDKESGSVSAGKEIKGGAAATKAASKLESPAIKAALEAIKKSQDLASFLQDVFSTVTEKGMDQEEAKMAVKKFGQAVLSAKKTK